MYSDERGWIDKKKMQANTVATANVPKPQATESGHEGGEKTSHGSGHREAVAQVVRQATTIIVVRFKESVH